MWIPAAILFNDKRGEDLQKKTRSEDSLIYLNQTTPPDGIGVTLSLALLSSDYCEVAHSVLLLDLFRNGYCQLGLVDDGGVRITKGEACPDLLPEAERALVEMLDGKVIKQEFFHQPLEKHVRRWDRKNMESIRLRLVDAGLVLKTNRLKDEWNRRGIIFNIVGLMAVIGVFISSLLNPSVPDSVYMTIVSLGAFAGGFGLMCWGNASKVDLITESGIVMRDRLRAWIDTLGRSLESESKELDDVIELVRRHLPWFVLADPGRTRLRDLASAFDRIADKKGAGPPANDVRGEGVHSMGDQCRACAAQLRAAVILDKVIGGFGASPGHGTEAIGAVIGAGAANAACGGGGGGC